MLQKEATRESSSRVELTFRQFGKKSLSARTRWRRGRDSNPRIWTQPLSQAVDRLKVTPGCIRISGLCMELYDLLRAMMESARLVLIGTTASRARGFVEARIVKKAARTLVRQVRRPRRLKPRIETLTIFSDCGHHHSHRAAHHSAEYFRMPL